ncbi:MAG: hypothetical protein ACM3JG_13465 [Thiohalocapsa sp.]
MQRESRVKAARIKLALRRHKGRWRLLSAAVRKRPQGMACGLGLTIGISAGLLLTMLGLA